MSCAITDMFFELGILISWCQKCCNLTSGIDMIDYHSVQLYKWGVHLNTLFLAAIKSPESTQECLRGAMIALENTYNHQNISFKINQKLEKGLMVCPWFLVKIHQKKIFPKSLDPLRNVQWEILGYRTFRKRSNHKKNIIPKSTKNWKKPDRSPMVFGEHFLQINGSKKAFNPIPTVQRVILARAFSFKVSKNLKKPDG